MSLFLEKWIRKHLMQFLTPRLIQDQKEDPTPFGCKVNIRQNGPPLTWKHYRGFLAIGNKPIFFFLLLLSMVGVLAPLMGIGAPMAPDAIISIYETALITNDVCMDM